MVRKHLIRLLKTNHICHCIVVSHATGIATFVSDGMGIDSVISNGTDIGTVASKGRGICTK